MSCMANFKVKVAQFYDKYIHQTYVQVTCYLQHQGRRKVSNISGLEYHSQFVFSSLFQSPRLLNKTVASVQKIVVRPQP